MILVLVKELRSRNPCVGARKLQRMLADPERDLPVIIGRDKLFDLLKRHKMLSPLPKKFKKTTNSGHRCPTYPNLIKGLKPNHVNQVWVCDITYIRLIKGKFAYLYLITDLFSRKIIAYALKDNLTSVGAEEAFLKAVRYAKPKPGFIHHSDRGIQYCCKSYNSLLNKYGAQISMTGDNHCYDNAVAERVNGILKLEYGLGSVLPSLDAAMRLTKDGINIYNSERLHLSLDYQTPDKIYELSKQLAEAQA